MGSACTWKRDLRQWFCVFWFVYSSTVVQVPVDRFAIALHRIIPSYTTHNSKRDVQKHPALPHLHVQLVVQVLVNLLAVPVLAQQAAQHTQAADPQQLGGQARLTRTTALTCGREKTAAGQRVGERGTSAVVCAATGALVDRCQQGPLQL